MNVYSIYDKKSATYSLPFYAPTHDTVCRVVVSSMIDRRADYYLHSEDYSIRFIGEYDEKQGLMIPCDPVSIKTCEELAVMADELRKRKLETNE